MSVESLSRKGQMSRLSGEYQSSGSGWCVYLYAGVDELISILDDVRNKAIA